MSGLEERGGRVGTPVPPTLWQSPADIPRLELPPAIGRSGVRCYRGVFESARLETTAIVHRDTDISRASSSLISTDQT